MDKEPAGIILYPDTLSKWERKLYHQAMKHPNCLTCFRYTIRLRRRHNWHNVYTHLVAQHGYDPRPWYKRIIK